MKKIALFFQYILPHRMLSRLMYYVMRIRVNWIKNLTIKTMVKKFNIDVEEAAESDFNAYPHFNAFFTRALKPDARVIDERANHIISPVDGVISQLGEIKQGRIIQAKNHSYSVKELLATEIDADYRDGQFITIYLSPKDYHRMHAPLECGLKSMRHIPGRLFSVADWTSREIPRLFARNERLVNHLETNLGPVAYVYVGAIFVSSIETVSNGVITPPYASKPVTLQPAGKTHYQKGDEMGRFNMGSTIILLFPKDTIQFHSELNAGDVVKLGQSIAITNQ
ncbi:archaetidylserine decarboxylase [Marinicella gelatinilytica]|uniref:archaetidylserine decarboxylase n=1 Tax=Marinicella gelatinilytica TaxID=2996017 RepID=UPI002260DCAA|nr:archaetidylserine decarboxylase [Marinicella gelatinilytica]MCX7546040.1 archaetidylserine decarboxylase [Marinicella gelatinilytica]